MQCMICNDDDDDDENGGDYDNDHGRDAGDINHDENDYLSVFCTQERWLSARIHPRFERFQFETFI